MIMKIFETFQDFKVRNIDESTIKYGEVGVTDLMDLSNLIDWMNKEKIDWSQPKPGWIKVSKTDLDRINNEWNN